MKLKPGKLYRYCAINEGTYYEPDIAPGTIVMYLGEGESNYPNKRHVNFKFLLCGPQPVVFEVDFYRESVDQMESWFQEIASDET